MEDSPLRTFIAIELPDDVRLELAKLIAALKKPRFGFVRWVNPQGIHLTLKFMGSVNHEKVGEINEVIKSAAAAGHRFSLDMSGLGFFPNSRRPRVFWIGITGDLEILLKLQADIDAGTEKLGFPGEKRPFSPHITLARINEGSLPNDLADFVKDTGRPGFEKKFHIEVDAVCLMRSELLRTGARYSKLFEAVLPR
jgi:RNA 2',3'-cyclic 3'-phosphodiesterase